MLKGIQDFFSSKILKGAGSTFDDPSKLPQEAKLAACAILLETASIDGEFLHSELQELALSVQKQFDLGRDELFELVDLADKEVKDSDDIGHFAALINQHFSAQQKEDLLTLVWQVIAADGRLEKKEERFAKQIMNRLKLSEQAMTRAKKRAAANAA